MRTSMSFHLGDCRVRASVHQGNLPTYSMLRLAWNEHQLDLFDLSPEQIMDLAQAMRLAALECLEPPQESLINVVAKEPPF